jgi:hypothetical protein
MIYTAEQIAKLRAETVAALRDYYDRPVTAPNGDDPTGSYTRQRVQQGNDAVTMVARSLKAGITMRHLAMDSHLPGLLIIQLIEDAQQRADAFVAEIHHLERSLDAVRQARIKDAQARFHAGECYKTKLAASLKITRPTLDAWLSQDPA